MLIGARLRRAGLKITIKRVANGEENSGHGIARMELVEPLYIATLALILIYAEEIGRDMAPTELNAQSTGWRLQESKRMVTAGILIKLKGLDQGMDQ